MSEPSLPAVDKVRSLVAGHAHLCLGELLRLAECPRPEMLACADAGWTALLIRQAPRVTGMTRALQVHGPLAIPLPQPSGPHI